MRWILVLLLMAPVARADEFDDVLTKYKASKMKRACDCNGPADCACGAKGDGPCVCPPCLIAKAKKSNDVCHCYRCADCQCAFHHECFTNKTEKPKKAPLLYKHVCGCPSMSCNCAPLGGCHCSENALFNRINPTWQASPAGGYSLWRGNEQLGYYDGKTYWPLNADGEWCEPTRAPIPLPRQQSSVTQHLQEITARSAPFVCRS